jgi:hypothetical protein
MKVPTLSPGNRGYDEVTMTITKRMSGLAASRDTTQTTKWAA